jgi:hypothetical protein
MEIYTMNKNHKKTSTERGQSLVELAVVVVILLLLLAGAVDLGRLMFTYLSMRDAAQEGAAYASINPNFCNDVLNRIKGNTPGNDDIDMWINGIQTASGGTCNGTVLTKDQLCLAQREIRIEVNQPNFEITMPLLGAFTGPTVHIKAAVTDSLIRPYCGTNP